MTALNHSPSARFPRWASTALAGACGEKAAGSFQIVVNLLPHGNTRVPQPTSSPAGALHPSRSSQHQPMHNLRGCRSERNKTIPVRVGNDADLRAGRLHSPDRPVLRLLAMVALVLDRHSLPPSPSRRFPCLKVVSAKPTMARELLHGLQPKFEN